MKANRNTVEKRRWLPLRVATCVGLGVATLCIVACSTGRPAPQPLPQPDPTAPIVLSPDAPATRGRQELNDDQLKEQHFGVFAAYTGAGDFDPAEDLVGNYLYNHQIAFSAEDNLWHGTPAAAYWPLDPASKLSFFAYAPYDASLSQVQVESYEKGVFQLDYSPSTTNIAVQADFCVADATTSLDRVRADGDIPIEFVHTLTRVNFYARYKGTPPAGYAVKIDELKLKGIIGHKVLTYDLTPDDDRVYSWSDDSDHVDEAKVEYLLSRSDVYQHLNNNVTLIKENEDAENPEGYRLLQLINGYLYLLPQTLTSAASIDVTYSFNEKEKICAQFTENIALPDDPVWMAGHVVNYKITLDVGNSSQIEIVGETAGMIEEWKESGNSGGDNRIK